VWLTGVSFEDRLETSGNSQLRLVVHGACFLGASGKELSAIQEFEERVKRNPALVSHSSMVNLEQIDAQVDQHRRYTYRTFQLTYRSEREAL